MQCNYCGNYVESSDRTCPSCGARINHTEKETSEIDLQGIIETLHQNNEDLQNITDAIHQTTEDRRHQSDTWWRRLWYISRDSDNVKSYLALSILSTLCCCFPFGIPAIIYGTLVNKRLNFGDVDGAMDASQKAKRWMLVTFIAGILFWVWAIVSE